MKINVLTSPPIVGEIYFVECVLGSLSNIGPHCIPSQWWPVLTPSHQDSVYFQRIRTIWQETEEGFVDIDEVYFEDDINTPHHYHVDPRFTPEEYYTSYEIENKDFHTIIRPESKVCWKEMKCVREMPIQVLFTGFGQRFMEDHRNKKIKCGRCPHKGINLKNVPVVDDVITCPAHGLKFSKETGRCIS